MPQRWCFRAGLAALAGVAACVGAASADEPASIAGRYALSWNGLPVGRMTLSYTHEAGAYTITMRIRVGGLAAVFVDGRSTLTARGLADEADLRPLRYRFRTHWRGKRYGRTVQFDANGAVRAVSWSWPDDERRPERTPVAEADQHAPDPLTLIAQMMRDRWGLVAQAHENGTDEAAGPTPDAAEARAASYDGARSLAYRLGCAGTRAIETAFQGLGEPAIRCTMRSRVTGGLPTDDVYNGREPPESETAKLHLAPVDGRALYLPVLMDLTFGGKRLRAELKATGPEAG